MNEKLSIGFIGLGLMGSAMVERLQALGYPMTVVANRNRTQVEAAVARGAAEAGSAREVAAQSDVVMLCMDTSASVEARMLGEDGVLAGVRPGALVIDFGTSLPDSTKRLAPMVAEKGATYMDAPLGRTPSHAKEGKLNIMAAGDADAFRRAEPIFADLGENVFHVGPLGAGHTLKLINNFFAMTTACAMAEAFAMADQAGIAREKLYGVMSAGPLRSGMMDFVKANAIDGNPQMLAFSIANARKDVGVLRADGGRLGGAERDVGGCQAGTVAGNGGRLGGEDGAGDGGLPGGAVRSTQNINYGKAEADQAVGEKADFIDIYELLFVQLVKGSDL